MKKKQGAVNRGRLGLGKEKEKMEPRERIYLQRMQAKFEVLIIEMLLSHLDDHLDPFRFYSKGELKDISRQIAFLNNHARRLRTCPSPTQSGSLWIILPNRGRLTNFIDN